MDKRKNYTIEEIMKSSINYFHGDELAASVWMNKYALKNNNQIYELNPDMMHHRLSKEFARIEKNYKNPMSEDDIYNLFKNFKYLVPQGSPMFGIGNDYQIVSTSNCFVIGNDGPSDSYGGIMKLDQEQVQLMKRRGGVGHDISNIRPEGSPVKNSAISSTGIVPFMERFSNTTREVSMKARRGALLLSISIKHPDSEKFIDAKLEQGKITGANISVKLTDEFMDCVFSGKPFKQQYPINSDKPIIVKEINAKQLWDKIIHNAWKSAEPGILYWDTVIKESVPDCYSDLGFKTVSTNPCFSGDTLVLTADGTDCERIDCLAKRDKAFYVYSTNEMGYLQLKEATAFKTGTKQLYKIQLSDGTSFRCTGEHRLAMSNGEYIYAKESKGKELFSVNSSWKDTNGEIKRYINTVNEKEVNHVFETYNTASKQHEYTKDNYEPGNKIDSVTVTDVIEDGIEDVYDLTVSDNHNFFIVTKETRGLYSNLSGVLVHNCGEIPLCPYDSCRLQAINLYSYVENPFTSNAKFNFDLFKDHVRKGQRLMDDLIDLELEKIDQILNKIKSDPESDEIKYTEKNLWENIRKKCIQGRRTGFGITAEGDMLAALGITYGTKEATEFATSVQTVMATTAYESSIEIAKERGPFEIYSYDREKNNPFVQRIIKERPDLDEGLKKYGRRNIALLTCAPVGSVSILTQTTSGIEPVFLVSYKRRKKINPEDNKYNKHTIIKDENGDCFEEFNVFHPKFVEWAKINGYNLDGIEEKELEKLIEKSPYYHATSADVNWVEKVNMQGSMQKWIDHSISVTVNIPENTPESVVSKIYETGWRSGCKGITCYRDGSRTGVLVKKEEPKIDETKFNQTNAPKRPTTLEADFYQVKAGGESFRIYVGLYDGKPYEMFALPYNGIDKLPNHKGKITKIKKQLFRFDSDLLHVENIAIPPDDDLSILDEIGKISEIISEDHKITKADINLIRSGIKNIQKATEETDRVYRNVSLHVSAALRHGMPIKSIISLENKCDDSIVSFNRCVAKILNSYIKDDNSKVDKCPECGTEIRHDGGCVTCPNCGWSKCG